MKRVEEEWLSAEANADIREKALAVISYWVLIGTEWRMHGWQMKEAAARLASAMRQVPPELRYGLGKAPQKGADGDIWRALSATLGDAQGSMQHVDPDEIYAVTVACSMLEWPSILDDDSPGPVNFNVHRLVKPIQVCTAKGARNI